MFGAKHENRRHSHAPGEFVRGPSCGIGSSGVPGVVSESGRLRQGAGGHPGGDRPYCSRKPQARRAKWNRSKVGGTWRRWRRDCIFRTSILPPGGVDRQSDGGAGGSCRTRTGQVG